MPMVEVILTEVRTRSRMRWKSSHECEEDITCEVDLVAASRSRLNFARRKISWRRLA